MPDLNLQELFGLKTDKKSEPEMPIVLLLQAIIGMLSNKRDENDIKDEREQGSMEVPVRPRIEPLGGG